jgi:RNA polymerase sigma factor (sigma-70 family)
LNINELYKDAVTGDKTAEHKLFQYLSERFEQFAHHRIWNAEDARDVAQDAMVSIAREYKSVGFETSFQAWAYKVLDNRILSYIKKKKQRGDRVVTVEDVRLIGDVPLNINPELQSRLLDCLKKVGAVNRRHARILGLHYQGYSTDEICGRLSMTKNGLYISLGRARTMLEICLETGKVE